MPLVPKRRLILVKLLTLFYFCCALPAKASLLFEQLPDPALFPFASGPSSIGAPLVIDDFEFTHDVELTELIFWTLDLTPSDFFDVRIMNGLSGLPETVASAIFEMSIAPSTPSHSKEVDSMFSVPLFKHTFELPQINLLASTQYFLQISANDDNFFAPLFWQTSSVGISGQEPWIDGGALGGGVQQRDTSTQMAFRLNGNVIPAQPVPEPQSIVLFLFAFLLLSYRIRLR